MAIYRGSGGAGDATGDATNSSQLALAAAAEAQASATSAASSATNAANSASAAATDATDAAASETNAAGSAADALASENAAASSASDAADSAAAAATSATNAASSASTASTQATNASNSASSASTSATNAANSATSASTSASSASTSATTASTAATNAGNSATAAATSATDAAASASTASTQATNASNSATAAASSATAASSSASSASSSASSASTSATNAASSASSASTSASSASTSATNASNSASSAATSATNAANSASDAADSAALAATFDPALYLTKANPSFTGTLTGTGDIRLNNGTADGAQLQLASSGYSDWNLDNYSGRLRAYYGSTEYFSLSNTGTLTVPTLAVTNTVTTANNLGLNPYGNGFKNRIINGAMMIDQRNAGASVTPANGAYTLDRWLYQAYQAGKITLQQNQGSITPPAGFKNYLGITSTSAYSVLTGEYFVLDQRIEGYNVADLAWGTSSASPVTLSFWVRSSLTGTHGGALQNSNSTRSYPFSYTINSANTWEYKTVSISGDTSGTWVTDSGIGIVVYFNVGTGATFSGTSGAWAAADYRSSTGATSVVGTNGATFYITGVQLEKGSTATSFDYRPYGTELALCQRYYNKSFNIETAVSTGAGRVGDVAYRAWVAGTSGVGTVNVGFPVTMRTTPTITFFNPINANSNWYNFNVGANSGAGTATETGTRGFVAQNSQVAGDSLMTPIGIHYSASAEL